MAGVRVSSKDIRSSLLWMVSIPRPLNVRRLEELSELEGLKGQGRTSLNWSKAPRDPSLSDRRSREIQQPQRTQLRGASQPQRICLQNFGYRSQ